MQVLNPLAFCSENPHSGEPGLLGKGLEPGPSVARPVGQRQWVAGVTCLKGPAGPREPCGDLMYVPSALPIFLPCRAEKHPCLK